MIPHEKRQLIRKTLRSLAVSHAAAVIQFEESIAVLTTALELDLFDGTQARLPTTAEPIETSDDTERPVVDRTRFSVQWRGSACFLGNTLLFRFLARLARTPNRYISHEDLFEEVWGSARESSTIRGVVKRLRDQLFNGGMRELAEAIDGTVPGHYGLKFV